MAWRNMHGMKWHREHLPDPLPAEPLELAASWLAEATRKKVQPNPDSMVLATCNASGHPSARVVLCKEIAPQPGYLTFYTNYHSRKGRDLHDNPHAAIVMYWDTLHRQVRVQGPIVQASAAESDAYFATRNWQSEPIASRAELLGKVAKAALRLALPVPADEQQQDPGLHIARPPHWGGYRLWAEVVELWVEGSARIHDRARWQRSLTARSDGFDAAPWSVTRLQP
jgi:pyridoxamine 5'-phosphate oxidase